MSKKKKVFTLLDELKQQRTGRASQPPDLVEELKAADMLVVKRPLTAAGVDYKIGEEIPKSLVESWAWGSKLLSQGYFLPKSFWDSSRLKTAADSHYNRVVFPIESLMNREITAKAKLEAEAAQRVLDLKHAEDEVKAKQVAIDRLEQELLSALEGFQADG